MEAEEAAKPVSEATAQVPSLSETSKAGEELIEAARPVDETNGTKLADENKKLENGDDSRKASNDEQPRQAQPSKRVQEGQRYNNRVRSEKIYNRTDQRKFDQRNIKSDPSSLQESSDPVAIRKQVEFYFSDSNLLQDKFLFTKVEGHKNTPVPIDVIHSFKRMHHFQPRSAIVDALKESETLNLVEDDKSIQRKEPLPEGLEGKPMVEIEKVYEGKSMAQSIYAKGFSEEQPSTQFDIEAFFAQFGQTNSVRLRRHFDGTFKRSVFVEFNSEETQKAFLALDPKPKWHGEELLIKSKKQYCDDKVDDIAAGRVRPNGQDRPKWNKNGRGGNRREDDRNDRDWRERREIDRKSGFKDRDGGRNRVSKTSGRGRDGGRRGGRGGRDRKDRDDRGVPNIRTSNPDSGDEASPQSSTPAETPVKDQVPSKTSDDAPKATENGEKTLDQNKTEAPATAGSNEDAPASTLKRARDEADETALENPAKKVDVKEGES